MFVRGRFAGAERCKACPSKSGTGSRTKPATGRSTRRFRRDASGATAVEFALVGPLLLMLLLGTLELGTLFAANVFLKNATYSMSRTGRTGYVADDLTQAETARAVLRRQAGVLMDADKLVVTSQAYTDFDELNKRGPFIDANGNGVRDDGENYTDVNGNGRYDATGIAGLGGTSQVVFYTVTYPWTFVTPLIGNLMTANGGPLMLTATAVVQNEPY